MECTLYLEYTLGNKHLKDTKMIRNQIMGNKRCRGNLPSDTYFLKAGELINFSIDVGFEGIDDEQAFAPGEGLVELIRGDM